MLTGVSGFGVEGIHRHVLSHDLGLVPKLEALAKFPQRKLMLAEGLQHSAY